MRTKRSMTALLAAGTSVAAMVLSGVGASSALAVTCEGQGSSLQKLAQTTWIAGSKLCAKYNTTSSGSARTAWGVELSGQKPTSAESPASTKEVFIGTDEPLDTAQISNLNEAAGAGVKGTGQTLTIPVVQAAIAVIFNPPASTCTIKQITSKELEEVFRGTKTEWSQLLVAGTGCTGTIELVNRSDVSGTTFVFKEYLSEENSTEITCDKKTWKELAEPANNLTWPTGGTCPAKYKTAAASGGGGEVAEVAANRGTIGYANLADARPKFVAGGFQWFKVSNKAGNFENPGTSATEPSTTAAKANCSGTKYGTKKAIEEAINPPSGPPAADDNWSFATRLGANLSNTTYPICTLTYDVGLVNYTTAGYTNAATLQAEAKAYLEWVTAELKGQKEIESGLDYAKLPKEVQEIAAKLAAKV